MILRGRYKEKCAKSEPCISFEPFKSYIKFSHKYFHNHTSFSAVVLQSSLNHGTVLLHFDNANIGNILYMHGVYFILSCVKAVTNWMLAQLAHLACVLGIRSRVRTTLTAKLYPWKAMMKRSSDNMGRHIHLTFQMIGAKLSFIFLVQFLRRCWPASKIFFFGFHFLGQYLFLEVMLFFLGQYFASSPWGYTKWVRCSNTLLHGTTRALVTLRRRGTR